MANPDKGKTEKDDLSGFLVYKFTYQKQKYLIAYRFMEDDILFYAIGSHKNFYRQLKKYLKGVK